MDSVPLLRTLLAHSKRGFDHFFRRPATSPQVADPSISIRLAQFLHRRFHDEGMVQKGRWLLAAEEPRNPDLPACRWKKIDAANDVIHTLLPVIHRDGELVGPVTVPIPQQHIAALLVRLSLIHI